MHRFVRTLVVLAAFLVPAGAFAQDSATIAGTVRDASGGVLPGVTVEASSPVLIEKVRSVTTNDTGQYSIVALPPGTYTLTFSLPGFNTVRQENIQLTAATRDDSPIARAIEKRGEGLHHVGYRVDNCAEALAAMVAAGATPIDKAPRPGSRGTTVAFVHPKGSFGTLIELVQE